MNKIKDEKISAYYEKIIGGAPNLWAYFIILSDLLLKKNGKIASVLPINFFRGLHTQKIREFVIHNYTIKYIIKPEKEPAFSESAQYRDVLLIAEKRKTNGKDNTKIIFVKTFIRDKDEKWVKEFISKIKEYDEYYDDDIEITSINYSELFHNLKNLMPYLTLTKIKLKPILRFLQILKEKLKDTSLFLRKDDVLLGFNTSPAGTAEKSFITKPITQERIKQAFLIWEEERENEIIARVKDTNLKIKIEKSKVVPALRTNTGVDSISINNKHDYIIIETPKEYKKIEHLIKDKVEEKRGKYAGKEYKTINYNEIKRRALGSQTFISLCIKFNPYSPNSHLFAFTNSTKFTPLYTFVSFPTADEITAKILSLFFNSIAYIVQFICLKSESQLQRTEIKIHDLVEIMIMDVKKLNEKQKFELLELYNTLENVKFPSLIKQFEAKFWARVELDKTILKILGFSDKEVEEWLPIIYDVIVEELKAMKEVS